MSKFVTAFVVLYDVVSISWKNLLCSKKLDLFAQIAVKCEITNT
jgi:hypothetical protein